LAASQEDQHLNSAGRPKLGIKEVDEGIWLASFMHYDLGYFDLKQRTLRPLDNPFGTRVVTHVLGTFRYLCLRAGQLIYGGRGVWQSPLKYLRKI